ncbi:putative WD40 repeat [Paratrimastix pyriformis]|uniref:WD40 repeat n=1 Tax=Paratrimastix pyriformis TaxID=342808 RepID=A0ABQ8UCV6_9EUKA|nr:putative WD40 repeat [Paratrimastix pyriformis]
MQPLPRAGRARPACAKLQDITAHREVHCLKLGRRSGSVLATGGDDNKVKVWLINKPEPVLTLTGHSTSVECVSFDPEERQLAAGSLGGALRIWDLNEGRALLSLGNHRSKVTACDFSDDSKLLVSGSMDTNAKVWDLRARNCCQTIKGHSKEINGVAFSPDGRWVLSVGEDCLAQVWDLTASRVLFEFHHDGPINTFAFHPSDVVMATGSSDRTVKVWDLEAWKWEDPVVVHQRVDVPFRCRDFSFVVADQIVACGAVGDRDPFAALEASPPPTPAPATATAAAAAAAQALPPPTPPPSPAAPASSGPRHVSASRAHSNPSPAAHPPRTPGVSDEPPLALPPARYPSSSSAASTGTDAPAAAPALSTSPPPPPAPASAPPPADRPPVHRRHPEGEPVVGQSPSPPPTSAGGAGAGGGHHRRSQSQSQEPGGAGAEAPQQQPAAGAARPKAVSPLDKVEIFAPPAPPGSPAPRPPTGGAGGRPASGKPHPRPAAWGGSTQIWARCPAPRPASSRPPRPTRGPLGLRMDDFLPKHHGAPAAGGRPGAGGLPALPQAPDEVLAALMPDHQPFCDMMVLRRQQVESVRAVWQEGRYREAMGLLKQIETAAVTADVLGTLLSSRSKSVFNLELCAQVVPPRWTSSAAATRPTSRHHAAHISVGVRVLSFFAGTFGPVIRAVMESPHPSIGVDLSQEERKHRCEEARDAFQEVGPLVSDLLRNAPSELHRGLIDLDGQLKTFL